MYGLVRALKMKQSTDAVVSDRERALTDAVLKTAELLNMKDREMAEVLGLSAGMISKMRKDDAALKERRHPFHMATALVRIYRSLAGIVGHDVQHIQAWFHAPNRDLDATPAELVRTPQGLFHTLQYLDNHRVLK